MIEVTCNIRGIVTWANTTKIVIFTPGAPGAKRYWLTSNIDRTDCNHDVWKSLKSIILILQPHVWAVEQRKKIYRLWTIFTWLFLEQRQRGVNPLPLIHSICQNGVVNICRLNPFLIRTIERIKCPTGKLQTTLSLSKLFADVLNSMEIFRNCIWIEEICS